jgi:hypothetical protein
VTAIWQISPSILVQSTSTQPNSAKAWPTMQIFTNVQQAATNQPYSSDQMVTSRFILKGSLQSEGCGPIVVIDNISRVVTGVYLVGLYGEGIYVPPQDPRLLDALLAVHGEVSGVYDVDTSTMIVYFKIPLALLEHQLIMRVDIMYQHDVIV